MLKYGCTTHAKKRIKQRASGNPQKLLDLAIKNGYKNDAFTGQFRRFIDRRSYELGGVIIVYKGNMYLIKGNSLITMYPIPQQYRKYKPKGLSNNVNV